MYLARAIINEFANPRLAITLTLRRWLGAVLSLRCRPGDAGVPFTNDTLQFVFDLSVAPITFDFASYLAGAEVERRLRGMSKLLVIIVPGENSGVRREQEAYEAAVNVAARQSRVRNVVLPLLSFLPSISGFVVCGSRDQAQALVSSDAHHVYPDGYSVILPRQPLKRVIHDHARAGVPVFPMFRATESARHFVGEFLARETRGLKPVVITLRNSDFSLERNSNNEAWLAFAERLDSSKFIPIFVHDTETAMRPPPIDLGDHVVCEAASWNLEIRMALYEAAWLNMAAMLGPLELAWYSEKARYVVFINIGVAEQNSVIIIKESGHDIGQSLVFAKPAQKIVWAADTLDRIELEFAAVESLMTVEEA